ncbi:MAG: cyclic beta 1-2 glucan synthetase [Planctomycetaceae bacterium]|nr:MAG: cyclic beta 1-2 glucan synthetase [Planctomycetaceae bacterium]
MDQERTGLTLLRKTIRQGRERLASRVGVDGIFRELGDDLPLRSEVFSVNQLERHAEALAEWHAIEPRPGPDRLLTRLADNERVLLDANRIVTEVVANHRPVAPAGEWLLDNFHVIEGQIRTARRHLPKQYSRGLPRLANGPSAGYPRVYDLALELISHVDGRVGAESLRSYIAAYQLNSQLNLGELWAIPIMLRQALIENLRRVAARIAKGTIERNKAGKWADQFIACAEQTPNLLILGVADMARQEPSLSSAFVAEMTRRLSGQNPALAIPLTWIEQRLWEDGRTIEQLVQAEAQQQAADQVSFGNSIGSLRELDAIDWRTFVESLSIVEQTLLRDPAGVHGKMDFGTRDQYRHVIERIAKRSPLTEQAVARQAVQLATHSKESSTADVRRAHVGYFLVDQGLPALELACRMRPSLMNRIGGSLRKAPLTVYLGAILIIALGVTVGALSLVATSGWLAWVLGGLLFLGATHLSVGLVNWLVTLMVAPHRLPRLDFSHGIPPEFNTLVAVPTMLLNEQSISRLLEGLEVRFLANRNDQLRFCLLTDFRDASQEHLAEDESLQRLAQAGIESLNAKYSHGKADAFFLFHRPRHWNSQEQAWMGQERKRGKLSDLNRLLRGEANESFSLIVGDTSVLTSVKYVITLDTDTLLPRDSARQLVATLAHPLNHPHVDAQRRIVTEGYGILQPGVATTLELEGQSWFARLNSGEPGIDPYTRATSDVYQDLFRQGSFIGKGIYDVDAFSAVTENRFLENQILSHDLLEGCYARCGLVNDVHVFESHPAGYLGDVSRRHRWMRGDWQISGWVLPFIAGPNSRFERNPLSLLSRWKILDNLRRSTIPCVLMLLLLLGWLMSPPAWLWTAIVVGLVLIPAVCVALFSIFRKAVDVPMRAHSREVTASLGNSLLQAALSIAVLPFEAYVSLDAFARTAVRMRWTHTRMLEWKTASDVEREVHRGLGRAYRTMWIAPVWAVFTAMALVITQPQALPVATPLILAWLLAPLIAWRISWPARSREAELSPHQLLFLHQVSRKTWRFFERFIGPEDHWLPPDNYQEEPVATLAHRTSPTNVGISLLSTLAAYDFGYISVARLIERTRNTFSALEQLERFHGHFLNWYDTRTLEPLLPRYVSSVDSGNLIGHLLTLRAGLLELPRQPLIAPQLWNSLSLLRQMLEDATKKFVQTARAERKTRSPALDSATFRKLWDAFPPDSDTSPDATNLLATLDRLGKLLAALAEFSIGPPQEEEPEVITWLRELERQCRDHRSDLLFVAPWLGHPPAPGGLCHSGLREDQQQDELQVVLDALNEVATLQDIADLERHLPALATNRDAQFSSDEHGSKQARSWMLELSTLISQAGQRVRERLLALERLALQCGELATVEYDFLYDPSRRLLTIGYNVTERRRDTSFYDLLASEARLASFVAIAQGQLEQEHWFALGRLLTTSHGQPALLSWSGSMFEYLMPLLVMPTYKHTLLDQTYGAVVDRHIEYGRQRDVPWGISESGYNLTDADLNYQYRAFGVPGLGFKRGLVDDLVIAPYATAMALMVAPEQACANLQRMTEHGFSGQYGFYEAVDYTRTRITRGQGSTVVRSYMGHHQGMSFLSLAYLLLDKPMQKRFQSDPQLQATELLLQERIPKAAPYYPHSSEVTGESQNAGEPVALLRIFKTPHTPAPEVHLLSNGRYHVMVTNAGGGSSSWKGLAVTRWREDPTRDNAGMFCYVRDAKLGKVWSTTHQPTRRPTQSYEAIFSQARAEYRRRDHDIAIHTEIAVSPEDDIEIRRSTITNHSTVTRTIELTSYAEVVLATPAADATHPAFSNLFVQTEILDARQAILCTRRPRSRDEQPPWMLHLMAVVGAKTGETSYETDRSKFIGRCRTTATPEAMSLAGNLSNSSGSVLDPMVAIRVEVTLLPDETVSLDYVTGMARTRESAVEMIDKYRDRHLADRVFDMAWTHGQVVLRQLNASEADAQLFGRLAGPVVFANAALRANAGTLKKNRRGQSGLWGHGISGDLPIVLLRIGNAENIDLVRKLVQAHAFWRLKGLGVDLVIWNECAEGYRQVLQDLIAGLVSAGTEVSTADHPGGIFVRRPDQTSDEDQILLQTVARVILVDTQGTLAEQLDRRVAQDRRVPELVPRTRRIAASQGEAQPHGDLVFENGVGGFTADGREYMIRTEPGRTTPAPWVNVIANSGFGTVISESGGAYSWSENAHEFRLTPWYNDPVSDASGEAFYLRDEESGEFWSPTPLPVRGRTPYLCRHGFGYSVFEHTENGITSELWVYVANDAPVKFTVLKVRNVSGRPRKISATACCEWVLGELRSKGLMHIVTEVDAQCGALLARNPYSIEFPDRIAFMDVNDPSRSLTGDRTEFLGRNGDAGNPAAMGRTRLSGKVGAGLDPCGAMQTTFDLADGREREITFMLGAGRDVAEVRDLVQRFRGVETSRHALEEVWESWNRTLGAVHVETPDPSVNVLANGWLLYQTLACRYWARSGYYQSGGAFGFRDQLQDVAALVHAEPQLIREHLLRCASRQFREGDVQHWWHPPLGRGVRTHFSDDLLWLPLITCRYVMATGDTGVLDELVPYLEGRQLQPDEEAYYDLPDTSTESGTLYEHCVRAITHGSKFGVHGLPLIGCGDWNDGMNLIGQHGKGESVWLAFFLYENLKQFSALARTRDDAAFADRCDAQAAQLREKIEHNGWDGQWYRRAYFDNGEPVGSASNSECQIDSIAQSWSVLSGAGDVQRSRGAMEAVYQRLVRHNSSLIQLFDPPFDKSDQEPGYIKGYVPGVRENGGQYTHAAIWTVMAFAELGDHQRAWELFAMINPINHAATQSQVNTYKVEPYVVAADVYAVPPHTGRGGWTWYTGSASWMYRLITESLLGLHLEADRLRIAPCLPADWTTFKIHYRYRETYYHITVMQPAPGRSVKRVSVDGIEQADKTIPLIDDRQEHQVEIELAGEPNSTISPP